MAKAVNNSSEGHRSAPLDPLLAALGCIEEEHLSAQIIRPILEQLHPGRLEYTHSGDEAGRDLISFGRDPLLPSRPHILCVQVKARRISHGAASFGEVLAVATIAKTEGVTLENGDKCVPNEVWYVTSHAFPEQKRRQVADTLQQLQRQNIKFISGEELCAILREQLPELAATLLKNCSAEVMHFVGSLSKHHEGRAFGLSLDREVSTFYVSTAISTETDLANLAVAGSLSVQDTTVVRKVPLLQLLNLDELDSPPDKRLQLVRVRATRSEAKFPEGFPKVDVEANVEEILRIMDKVIKRARSEAQAAVAEKNADLVAKPISFNEALQVRLADIKLDVRLTYHLQTVFAELRARASHAVLTCPKVLDENSSVRTTVSELGLLDGFVRTLRFLFKDAVLRSQDAVAAGNREILRVRVVCPERLLDVGKVLLVEGPAGCGKTTLLKVLGIRLAELGRRVAYLPCAELLRESRTLQLREMARKSAKWSEVGAASSRKAVLIVDGLDEASFDLSEHIRRGKEKFEHIIVSCRNAFPTDLRQDSPRLALSLFTDNERSEFFARWFVRNPELYDRAVALVKEHQDIATHTKLPLIATIVAALLENGIEPRTRADVYNKRLDLLLSYWDKARGVRRLRVDSPDAKRRFLRRLAFKLHTSGRNRLIEVDGLRAVFDASLGKWGYDQDFESVLHDLVVGSGVLTEERSGVYSLGHLTFQEHLTGEYLAHDGRIEDVAKRVGDDWWKEALNFYASVKGDITELVDRLLGDRQFGTHVGQIGEMARYAPYTSAGAMEAVRYERQIQKEERKQDLDF